MIRSRRIRALAALVLLLASATFAAAQQRRDREPNSVYAARRAALAAQVDGPIILWGFTDREEVAQTYIFSQEYDFYYLTGHNEEGAGLLILPAKNNPASDGPSEILFLPTKNLDEEKWNGVRKSRRTSRARSREAILWWSAPRFLVGVALSLTFGPAATGACSETQPQRSPHSRRQQHRVPPSSV